MLRDQILIKGQYKCGIPCNVLEIPNTTLSSDAKLVFGYLIDRLGENETTFPGKRRISKDTGISFSTVKRSLITLKKLGLLSWVSGGKKYDGSLESNEYTLFALPQVQDEPSTPQVPVEPTPRVTANLPQVPVEPTPGFPVGQKPPQGNHQKEPPQPTTPLAKPLGAEFAGEQRDAGGAIAPTKQSCDTATTLRVSHSATQEGTGVYSDTQLARATSLIEALSRAGLKSDKPAPVVAAAIAQWDTQRQKITADDISRVAATLRKAPPTPFAVLALFAPTEDARGARVPYWRLLAKRTQPEKTEAASLAVEAWLAAGLNGIHDRKAVERAITLQANDLHKRLGDEGYADLLATAMPKRKTWTLENAACQSIEWMFKHDLDGGAKKYKIEKCAEGAFSWKKDNGTPAAITRGLPGYKAPKF